MSTPYPSTCPKCAKCRLYIQRRCKGLLDYQRRWCPEWITFQDAGGRLGETGADEAIEEG